MRSANMAGWKQLTPIVLSVAFVGIFLLYARLHFSALTEFWPLNLRESAHILNTKALLAPETPPIYALSSVPEQANLYGPLYPIIAAPLALLFAENLFFAHRLTNMIVLALCCGLIGFLISSRNGRLYGIIGAAFYYVATVASPSIAAGPDLLAVFFYIAAIGVIQHFGFNLKFIAISAALALCGFLSKPYAVLAIPGLLSYVYLFVSPKRALIAASGIALASVIGFFILAYMLPAYFHSVFAIHSFYATRFLDTMLSQSWEFLYLYFSLIILFTLHFPYRALTRFKKMSLKGFVDEQPFFANPISFNQFMTLIAAGVLLLVMGWHGGAYLIYYNHLLLPPLLIAALSHPRVGQVNYRLGHILLAANALALLVWLPAKPRGEGIPEAIIEMAKEDEPILIDPVLAPLMDYLPEAHLVDNGQSEYLVIYDLLHESISSSQSRKWQKRESERIEDQEYKYLILCPLYNRSHLFIENTPRDTLSENYAYIGYFELHIYHSNFRNREEFGNSPDRFLVFQRKGEAKPAVEKTKTG